MAGQKERSQINTSHRRPGRSRALGHGTVTRGLASFTSLGNKLQYSSIQGYRVGKGRLLAPRLTEREVDFCPFTVSKIIATHGPYRALSVAVRR